MCAVLFICWSLVAFSQISVKQQGTRHHFRSECDTVYIRDDDTQRVDATNMYVTEEMLHEYSRSASAQEEMLRKYALRAQDTPTTSTQSAESKSCDGEKSTAVAAGGNSSRPVPATVCSRAVLGISTLD